MSRIEANQKAPVVEVAAGCIKAPVETVWRILSDLENWPSWNKSVSKIRVNGPVIAGTSFVWVAGGSRITSRLEEVIPPKRIAWTGKMFRIRAVHVWELGAKDGETRVRTEESFEGLVARLFRGSMKKLLAKTLSQGIASLKLEAESRLARSKT